MPEPETPSYVLTLIVLLSVCLFFLACLVLMHFRLSRRLRRVEGQLEAARQDKEEQEAGPSVAESSPGGTFEIFLNENSAHREMSKSEQFAAFRKWRHAKGMNWSK